MEIFRGNSFGIIFIIISYNIKTCHMKNVTKTTPLLKAIDLELKAILAKDIRKFNTVKEIKNKNAAFLQLIAA